MSLLERPYPVYEFFASFQGEGAHLGRRAFFVRLYGCDQRCPWCDSAGTWHPSYTPRELPRLTAKELAREALRQPVDFVVLTGGEPTLYDLWPLIREMHKINLPVHLETAGHHKPSRWPDWLTLSPKLFDGAKPVEREVARRADEIKFIIERPEDIERALAWLQDYAIPIHSRPVWLHPEWGHRGDGRVLSAIRNAVMEHGFRAGYQVHKLYLADIHDRRARRDSVPLGGDPSRGPAQ